MPDPFTLPQMPGGMMGDLLDTPEMRRQRAFDALGGLGSALIQAGSPSPYPMGFGDIIGRGLAGAAQGMSSGEDKYLKRALANAQVQQAQGKMAAGQAIVDAFKRADGPPAGGGVPQPGYQQEVAPGNVQNGPNPNNIGNVRPVGGGPTSGFQQPPDFNSGVMLAVNNAKSYPGAFNNGQPMTLLQIGERWAPKGDGKNDPTQWARNVASHSGLPLDQPIDLNNPAQAAAFARGVHGAEWGGGSVRPINDYATALTTPMGGAAPPNAGGQGDGGGVIPAQYTPQQPRGMDDVIRSIPPAMRVLIMAQAKGDPQGALSMMAKYADPETTPAIDARTGQVVFAPKHALSSGQFTPLDAQKLANENARLDIERKREDRENANRNVTIGPDGRPVVNQQAVDAKTAISAAQGTDPAGKMLIGDYDDVRKANTDMQSNALIARTGIAQTQRLGQLLDQVKTGRFTSTTQEIKQMAKGVGVNLEALGIKDDTAPAQAAQALTGQLALALRNPSQGAGMPGAMSDADRQFLTRMVPGLETTPEGRKLMVEYSMKMYQRQIDMAKIANDFMRSAEAKKDPNKLYQVLQDYADKNPMFSEKDLPAGGFSPAPAGSMPNIPAPPPGFKVIAP